MFKVFGAWVSRFRALESWGLGLLGFWGFKVSGFSVLGFRGCKVSGFRVWEFQAIVALMGLG